MPNLITDGSLVGFWPLNEPSGAPIWQNYSPAFGFAPSGIGLDLTVAVADVSNLEEFMSVWPGRATVFNPESGVFYTGYQVQGAWKTGTDSSPLSRYLVMAGGSSRGAQQIWQPAIANSGFTVGFWVYPNSNGNLSFYSNMLASTNSAIEACRAHTLVGAFQSNTSNAGWHIGISGAMDRAAQFNFDATAGNQLRAFAFIEKTGTAAPADLLSVPIESGKFTHLSYSFRFIDGVSNQIVLYKDGHVAVSGTTSASLTAANTNLITNALARSLTVGASDDGTTATDDYERTSGWNHLVSGLYFFKRVLNEGEVLEMHQRGGLQPALEQTIVPSPTRLTSSYLIAYYPFMEPGYGDVSSTHLAANSNYDAGSSSERVFAPGPHGFGGVFHNGTNTSNYHAVPSGVCFEMLDGGSWTFGTWCSLNNAANRDDNIFFSWGSVTTVTNAALDPASAAFTTNTGGIVGTVSGVTNQQRIAIEVYTLGSNRNAASTRVFNLDGSFEYYNQSCFHIALAYDNETRGLSVFLNGHLAQSGTLPNSLTDQLRRITGSGYPLMFGNGVQDGILDSVTRGLHTGGGIDIWLGPCFMANGALNTQTVRGIALSGIVDLSSIYRTRHDPRLVGYWPCNTYLLSDVLVLDEARVWSRVPSHLVRGDSSPTDERWYDVDLNDAAGSVYRNDGTARIDHFGTRTNPPELSSYGNLGITSGIFVANAGSLGTEGATNAGESESSYGNNSIRHKPVIETRSSSAQNIAGEYIVAFEVTPSGRIPAVDTVRTAATTAIHTNCLLFAIGNQASSPGAGDASYHGFLTSLNANNPDPLGFDAGLGGSGVIIKIMGSEDTITAANQIPLVSGRLPFGVPSKVLVHTKFDNPYLFNGITAGQSSYTISLWINGVLTHRRTLPHVNSRVWSDGVVEDAASTVLVQFGGVLASDLYTSTVGWQAGLGDIFMREIFLMKGVFLKDEVAALANSGIQSPSIAGFTNQMSTTQVTIADADIQGYWRFNGFDGNGSGTTDLSPKNNHLFPAAQRYNDTIGATQAANYIRYAPAMFKDSSLGVQCSGISYNSLQVTNSNPNRLPIFMASGSVFNNPNDGFSIGFFAKKKEDVVLSRFDLLLAYGIIPTSVTTTTVDNDYGWVIGQDDSENMKMIISTSGNMYLSNTNNAAMSGQVMCGIFGEGTKSSSQTSLIAFDRIGRSEVKSPRLDSWAHYCWTYDPADFTVRCYLNGELVDSVRMKLAVNPANSIQIPADPFVRHITFLQHATDAWTFNTINIYDFTSVLTDVFYFSRSLSEPEVRYIALNGIDDATGTVASGVIGGFVHGQDTGSGLIGGLSRGQDTASGVIGAYISASTAASGLIGGYVSGIVFGTGTIGGFLQGVDTMSGIAAGYVVGVYLGSGMVAGYIHGQNVGSGLFGGLILGSQGAINSIGGLIQASDLGSGIVGGYMLGGLLGRIEFDTSFTVEVMAAQDFDAQMEIAKTIASDFDAKLVIFQNEVPPLVSIIVPNTTVSGLMPPFNQYFVGVASGQRGKTITQTRWNFSDFTPSVSVAVSGAGFYPIQHRFAASGFYIVRFEAIDSDGLHASATRIVNAASGINPVIVSLSGVPRSGNAGLTVDFTTTVDILPPGVSIVSRLLAFDDGQTTTAFSPTHVYTEPGTYKPIWCVRDSRGVTWCDSLEAGNDFLANGGA